MKGTNALEESFKSKEGKTNTTEINRTQYLKEKVKIEHKEILKNEIYYFLDLSSR